jgi:hypothetical protein
MRHVSLLGLVLTLLVGCGSAEEPLARIAQREPSFGGHVRSQGRLVLYLTDVSRLESADRVVREELPSAYPDAQPAVARQGQFGYLQLRDWLHALVDGAQAAGPRGMTLLYVEPALNRVFIGVDDLARTPDVEAYLDAMQVPRNAVVIELREAPAGHSRER